MKTQLKSILIGSIAGAIIYAVLMAVFDYYDGQDFRIWRFIFNMVFVGTFTGISIGYSLKKQSDRKKED